MKCLVGSCRVELRAEAGGLQPPYPVPGLKLPMLVYRLSGQLEDQVGLEPTVFV
jgi:hypothetical protein